MMGSGMISTFTHSEKAFRNVPSPAAQPLSYYQLARALLQVVSSNLLLETYLVNSKVFE